MNDWSYVNVKKELESWLHAPQSKALMHERSLAKIEFALATPTPTSLAIAASALSRLAMWEAANALAIIGDNTSTGWRQLEKSRQLEFWSIRILVANYDQSTKRTKESPVISYEAANALAHALAVKANDDAEWLGERLLGSLDDGCFGNEWIPGPYTPFMAKLYILWRDGCDNAQFDTICDSGIFAPITDCESADELLKTHMEQACDYHIAHAIAPGEDGFGDFSYYPYSAFPCELIAAIRIRNNLQLPVPEIAHPLLHSPFCNLPDICPVVENEIVQRIAEAMHAIFEDSWENPK